MKLAYFLATALALVAAVACGKSEPPLPTSATSLPEVNEVRIQLPEPIYASDVSLEECLAKRRSIRDYTGDPLSLPEVSQLLWAAQGITSKWGGRTAPSAGALYPLNVYLVAGNVRGIELGVYRYEPQAHTLVLILDKDIRRELAGAALGQSSVANAPIDIVITAIYRKTTQKYGERGIQYVHIEVGHVGQNICLQATALELGAVTIGAFRDKQVRELIKLPEDEQPLYIIPVGKH